MEINLSTPQQQLFNSQYKHTAVVAGYGSGKTFSLILKMLTDYFTYKGCHLCYLAPTYSLVSDIAYPLFEEFLLSTGTPYSLNKKEGVLQVPGYGRIFFRTFTHPSRIIGFSILRAYLDEIDVVPASVMAVIADKIVARIRQKISGVLNQLFYISSPEGYGYMYKTFEKDPIKGSTLIRMTTYDNIANLPNDYIDTMKDKYPASLIDAYIYGKFVNINALSAWYEYDRVLNDTDVLPYDGEPLLVGMDFNVGRGCAVAYVERDAGLLYAVGEISGTLDTQETICQLQKRYGGHKITVYPDSSGRSRHSTNATESDFTLVKDAKFKLKVNNKNPNVKDRVTATNARFNSGTGVRKLFVNQRECPVLADALTQQAFNDKGVPIKDGKLDDITDAASYPVAYKFPVRKRSFKEVELDGV